jgi:hypothetical protein
VTAGRQVRSQPLLMGAVLSEHLLYKSWPNDSIFRSSRLYDISSAAVAKLQGSLPHFKAPAVILWSDGRKCAGSSVWNAFLWPSFLSLFFLIFIRYPNSALIPDRGRGFFLQPLVQTSSGAHPASYTISTGGFFPGGKAWPGRDADHSPPSSAEVKKE